MPDLQRSEWDKERFGLCSRTRHATSFQWLIFVEGSMASAGLMLNLLVRRFIDCEIVW